MKKSSCVCVGGGVEPPGAPPPLCEQLRLNSGAGRPTPTSDAARLSFNNELLLFTLFASQHKSLLSAERRTRASRGSRGRIQGDPGSGISTFNFDTRDEQGQRKHCVQQPQNRAHFSRGRAPPTSAGPVPPAAAVSGSQPASPRCSRRSDGDGGSSPQRSIADFRRPQQAVGFSRSGGEISFRSSRAAEPSL